MFTHYIYWSSYYRIVFGLTLTCLLVQGLFSPYGLNYAFINANSIVHHFVSCFFLIKKAVCMISVYI